MEIIDYLNLIPSANRQKPDFVGVVTINVSVAVQVQKLLQSMIPIFDLDLPPIGDQLDIIGQWVGISRNIPVPISGVFFTWDGPASQGWDFGTWRASDQTTQLTRLPDDAYLTLIKGKIAANQWNGTTNGAYQIFDALFDQFTIIFQDYQNMSYAVAIVGSNIDTLTLAIITGGLIPLRPEGIEIKEYFLSPGPIFAWDSDAPLLQGWDTGLWATELPPT